MGNLISKNVKNTQKNIFAGRVDMSVALRFTDTLTCCLSSVRSSVGWLCSFWPFNIALHSGSVLILHLQLFFVHLQEFPNSLKLYRH
jgi:hypothetical protein